MTLEEYKKEDNNIPCVPNENLNTQLDNCLIIYKL